MENKKNTLKIVQLIFWVLAGAVIAPIILFYFSYSYEDPGMRRLLHLIFVTVAGAGAARVVYGLVFLQNPDHKK